MEPVKIIEIKKGVFEDNDRAADALRGELKKKGVFLLNLMSSPGSGKTTTLIQTINRLKDKIRIAVMEADIDGDVDAIKIKEATGVESIQLHTGGMCHLDAEMTEQGLDAFGNRCAEVHTAPLNEQATDASALPTGRTPSAFHRCLPDDQGAQGGPLQGHDRSAELHRAERPGRRKENHAFLLLEDLRRRVRSDAQRLIAPAPPHLREATFVVASCVYIGLPQIFNLWEERR